MVSSTSGLAEREREREWYLRAGSKSEVADAFPEDVAGEMTEMDELVEAFETVRPRFWTLFALFGVEGGLIL